MNRRAHWDGVYGKRASHELSWFERSPETSLRLIEAARLGREARILDVGCGTSTLVDELLHRGYHNIGLLDTAAAALEVCRRRLGRRAAGIEWFDCDVTEFESRHPWDLWHDRAVLHFLTVPEEIAAYRRVLRSALAEGGQVVIGTFGPQGPTRCSGLDVHRYDVESLHHAVGRELELVDHELQEHLTPSGVVQQFLFCRFRRP